MIRSDPSLAAKSTTQHNKTVHSESKILSCPSRVSSPSRSSYVVSCVLALSRITRRLTVFFSSCLLILSLGASPAIALDPGTLPEGGVVISGAASTSTQDAHMQIETSQNVSIDWQTFNIGSQASVTFHQPNSASVALNRVLQAGASEIYGSLTANGQVFLLNPSGVIFGAGAQVDINGGLVASSLSLNDADFASGNYAFHNGTGSGAVENHGSLKGRYVVLLGETVKNTANIDAGNGGVAMVAADSVTLGMPGNELVTVEVTRKALAAAITNEGAITALGGNALLATAQSMDNLLSGVINNTGSIKATRINNTGGTVTLIADGDLENTGTITANAAELASGATLMQHGTITANRVAAKASDYNQAGTINADAGTVSVDAATIYLQGTIDASATNANSNGGTISLTSTKSLDTTASARLLAKGKTGGSVSLDGGAHGRIIHSGLIDATGTDKGGRVTATAYNASVLGGTIKADGRAQGGTINWGGNYQGKGTLRHATQSLVSTGSQLTTMGEQGGTIVIWSTDVTRVGGTLKSGSKGSIEVSSKGALDIYRSARLLAGAGGTLLLDPKNIIIDDVPGYTLVKLAFGDRFHDFGRSVAYSNGGERLAVGAPNDDSGGPGGSNVADFGAVYFFDGLGTGATIGTPRLVNTLKNGSSLNNSSSFIPEGKGADQFSTLSLTAGDNFGQSVALTANGKRFAVGAPGDDTGVMIDPKTGKRLIDPKTGKWIMAPNSTDRGAVYVFTDPFDTSPRLIMRLSDESVFANQAFTRSEKIALKDGDKFGYAVDFDDSGAFMAVGAPGTDSNNRNNNTGAVYLFDSFQPNNGIINTPRYTEKLEKFGLLLQDASGYSNDAPDKHLNGLDTDDKFGSAVALDKEGHRLAVGAPGDDGKDNAGGADSGAVYLFDRLRQLRGRFYKPRYAALLQSGYRTLIRQFKFTISAGDGFGSAVAFGNSLLNVGGRLAIGAPGDDAGGANSGAVYLFDGSSKKSFADARNNLRLNYAGKLTRSSISSETSSSAGGEFGAALAFNSTGDRLAIGAPSDAADRDKAGVVYLFGGLGTGAKITLPTAVAPGVYPSNTDRVALSVLKGTLDGGSNIDMTASNDITWMAGADLVVVAGGNGGNISLSAGRSLLLNSNITTDNGDVTLIANDTVANGVIDAERESGDAVITMASGTTINAGAGNISLELGDGGVGKTNIASGNIIVANMNANSIAVENKGSGAVTLQTGSSLTAKGTGADDKVLLSATRGNVDVKESGSITGKTVEITAGNNVLLLARSTVEATDTVKVSATGGFAAGSATRGNVENYGSITGKDIKLIADNNVRLLTGPTRSTVAATDTVTVSATTGNVNNSGSITGKTVKITAGKDVKLQIGSTVEATGTEAGDGVLVSATATTGNVNNSGSITGKTVKITAGNDVTLQAKGSVTANGTGAGDKVKVSTTTGNVDNSASITGKTVEITAGKDVKLQIGSTVEATGTGNALTISVGRGFINRAGATALNASNDAGRWLVWSDNPSTGTRGDLAYDFKQYDATYSDDMAELHQDERNTSHNGFLYSSAAILSVALQGEVSKPFVAGNNTAELTPANYTIDPASVIDDDRVIITTTDGTYNDATVGTGKLVTVTNPVVEATNGTAKVYGYRAPGRVTGAVGVITAAAPAPDPTPDPVVPTPDPVVPDPVVPTPDPVVPDPVVPDPVVPTPDPVVPDPVVPDPVVPTPDPVVPTPDPVVPAPAPAPTPVVPAPAPAPTPVVPAPAPTPVVPAPAPTPVVPAPAPTPVVPAPAPTPVVPAPAPTPVVPAPAPTPVVPAPAPTPVVPAPAPAPVVPAPAPQSGSTGGGQSGTSTNNNDQMPEPEQEMLSSERQEQQQAASFIDAAEHAEASESTTSNTGHISYASSEESPLRLGCPGGSAVALSRGTEDQEISSSVASLTCQSQ